MPTVFIIAEDWMLRAAVRAELRERGIEALGMESAADAGRAIAEGTMPSLMVLEATTSEPDPAIAALAKRVPVIVVASRSQRVALLPGAAAILYRPVRVGDVVACAEKLLQGEAA